MADRRLALALPSAREPGATPRSCRAEVQSILRICCADEPFRARKACIPWSVMVGGTGMLHIFNPQWLAPSIEEVERLASKQFSVGRNRQGNRSRAGFWSQCLCHVFSKVMPHLTVP